MRSFVNYLVNYLNDNNADAPVDTYILDNFRGQYKNLANLETVKVYTTEEEVFNENVSKLYYSLEERYERKAESAIDDRFALLILNSSEYYENLTSQRDILGMYSKIFTKYKNDKVFIVVLDCESTVGIIGVSEFIRFVRDERCAMTFSDISNQHVIELPTSIARKYQKKITPGDAYLLVESNFYKIRAVYDQNCLK